MPVVARCPLRHAISCSTAHDPGCHSRCMSDAPRLDLQVVDVPSLVAGQESELVVTVQNRGDDRLLGVRGTVARLWLTDNERRCVTEDVWSTPAARQLDLAPGERDSMTGLLRVRGPRGGATSAPLPPGDYWLVAAVPVTLQDEEPVVLESAAMRVTVMERGR